MGPSQSVALEDKLVQEAGKRGQKTRNTVANAEGTEDYVTPKVVQPHLLKTKKAMQAAVIAEAAAKAAAEAAVPKPDVKFMEQPISSMSDLQLACVTFFAGIYDWLDERFIRFA